MQNSSKFELIEVMLVLKFLEVLLLCIVQSQVRSTQCIAYGSTVARYVSTITYIVDAGACAVKTISCKLKVNLIAIFEIKLSLTRVRLLFHMSVSVSVSECLYPHKNQSR